MQNRVYSFEGVTNFRDFGGYDTADSRRVVTGKLFRSAHLAAPTPADRAKLDALGIRMIIDLRRPHERDKEPSAWPAMGAAEVIFMPPDKEDHAEAPHLAFLRQPDLTAESVRDFVAKSYRNMPYDPRHIYLYSAYFDALDRIDGASLVHCAFGKDRTGILCGLTLMALGVPEETVIEDFVLTNTATNVKQNLPLAQERYFKTYGVRPEINALVPMLGVEALYLRNCFDEMRRRNGSIEGYLRELGVDAPKLQRFKDRFLT